MTPDGETAKTLTDAFAKRGEPPLEAPGKGKAIRCPFRAYLNRPLRIPLRTSSGFWDFFGSGAG